MKLIARKKTLALLLALLMLFSAFPVFAETAGADTEGKSYTVKITWSDSDKLPKVTLEEQPVTTDETEPGSSVAPLTEYWTADSAAAEHLRDYVAKVTDENDPENFIPKKTASRYLIWTEPSPVKRSSPITIR